MIKYILLFLMLSIAALPQTKTKEQLAVKVLGIIQTGDNAVLKEIQATPDIYRKVAPTQMKDKSDDEIMLIVNTGSNSLTNKLIKISNSLVTEDINPKEIKFKSVKEKKYEPLKMEWKVFEAVYSLGKFSDSLLIEAMQSKNGFYLIDIANDDKEFSNFEKYLGKRDAKFYLDAGLRSKELREWEQASDYFYRAIGKDSKEIQAYFELAYALVETNNLTEAEYTLQMALKLKSDTEMKKKIWNELGYIYQITNRDDDAIKYYKLIIDAEPSSYFPYYNIGMIEYKRSYFNKAAEYFGYAVKNNPNNYHQPFYMQGMSLYKDRKYEEAQSMLYKALEIEPDNEEAMYVLGWIYNEFGYFTRAIDIYEDLQSKYPRNFDATYELAYAYKKSSMYQKALDKFIEVENYLIETNDKNISMGKLCNHIAEVCSAIGNNEKACDYIRKAKNEGFAVAEDLEIKNCK